MSDLSLLPQTASPRFVAFIRHCMGMCKVRLGEDVWMIIQNYYLEMCVVPLKQALMAQVLRRPMFYQRFTSMATMLGHTMGDEFTVGFQPNRYEITTTDEPIWEDIFDDLHDHLCEKYNMMFIFYFHHHYCIFECGHFKLICVIRRYTDEATFPNAYVAAFHTLRFDSLGQMGYDTWLLEGESVVSTLSLRQWQYQIDCW